MLILSVTFVNFLNQKSCATVIFYPRQLVKVNGNRKIRIVHRMYIARASVIMHFQLQNSWNLYTLVELFNWCNAQVASIHFLLEGVSVSHDDYGEFVDHIGTHLKFMSYFISQFYNEIRQKHKTAFLCYSVFGVVIFFVLAVDSSSIFSMIVTRMMSRITSITLRLS